MTSSAEEARARLAREESEYRERHGAADLPPAAMRFRVWGEVDIDDFRRSGDRSWEAITGALATIGRPLVAGGEFSRALDFGCGCGRVIAAARRAGSRLAIRGTDVDAEAVAWCKETFPGDEFFVGPALPPLPFEDGAVDLAWAISVFTHLDEERQHAWLAEMRRVLRPGGILIATVYGRPTWEPSAAWYWSQQSAEKLRAVEERGFHFANAGSDESIFPDTFPEWYQMAWHTQAYVEREWARHFKVRLYRERGIHDEQDLVVLER